MRELVASYLSKSISRRGFLKGLTKTGVSLAAAESILKSLAPHERISRREYERRKDQIERGSIIY